MAPPDMQPWKMTPPTLSPLHMTPPNMELPNFSPIQDHMPLPTLSASTFIPPQSFLTHGTEQPISTVKFGRYDPTLMVTGACREDPDEATPNAGQGKVTVWWVEDVEREVRGDAEMIARGVYEVRKKVRPRLHEMNSIETPSGVLDLVFSPHKEELLFATLASGEIIAYRVRPGRYTIKEITSFTLAENTPVQSLIFHPSNPTLAAAATSAGTIHLLNIPRNLSSSNAISQISALRAHNAPCLRVRFSADGKRLYSAGEDGVLISWKCTDPENLKQKWTSDDIHHKGITEILPWPAPLACDVNKKRKLLLSGSYDGKMRVMDMSSHVRPPYVRQELDLKGTPWNFAPLPPLPIYEEIKKLGAGVFSAASSPGVELDPEQAGLIVAAGKGGARILIHKQKFEEVFLPRRDGSDIVDWTTSDGVKMDHEGREKQYYWYDLADIEEHGDSKVYATDAVAIVDYDPLFKDAGEQRLRRGWRLCSVSRDGTMCFWQVYIE
ncbi:WD40-repeat-containing domain protein [Pyronema domesticum]|nr:WD40-repeat-containing domain protein [Pyronema domesticum]